MSRTISPYYLAARAEDKKVEAPTYVRRISARKYEYGHIAINFADRRLDTYVPSGEALSYAKACAAIGMLPAQPNIPTDLRGLQ